MVNLELYRFRRCLKTEVDEGIRNTGIRDLWQNAVTDVLQKGKYRNNRDSEQTGERILHAAWTYNFGSRKHKNLLEVLLEVDRLENVVLLFGFYTVELN